MADPLPFTEAPRLSFHLQLFTRIPDADARDSRKYASEQLSGQTLVPPRRDRDEFNGIEYTEWRFNAAVPEQVKLWLETKPNGRGYHSVDASGPNR